MSNLAENTTVHLKWIFTVTKNRHPVEAVEMTLHSKVKGFKWKRFRYVEVYVFCVKILLTLNCDSLFCVKLRWGWMPCQRCGHCTPFPHFSALRSSGDWGLGPSAVLANTSMVLGPTVSTWWFSLGDSLQEEPSISGRQLSPSLLNVDLVVTAVYCAAILLKQFLKFRATLWSPATTKDWLHETILWRHSHSVTNSTIVQRYKLASSY